MSVREEEISAPQTPPLESPGKLISAAREAASLSPADLAMRLRLDTKIVQALERDDFDSLPAPTFIKGYISSIAKELDIEPAPILNAYINHASMEPPSLADFSSRPPEQIGLNSGVVKIATYALAALLLILIALWWHSAYDNNLARPSTSSQEAGEEILRPEPLSYEFAVVEHDETSWQNPMIDESTAEVPATDTPIEADGSAYGISISTGSEAWVEIYDREDNRLYYGMARSGKTVEVTGTDFYRLVIGNSDSVTLRFNGAVVDLAPYVDQGVAQLTLPLSQ